MGASDWFDIWDYAMAHAPGGLQRILIIKLRLTRLAAYREFSVHWHRAVACSQVLGPWLGSHAQGGG